MPNPAISGAPAIPGRNPPSPRATFAADLARAVASLAAVGDVAAARIAAEALTRLLDAGDGEVAAVVDLAERRQRGGG